MSDEVTKNVEVFELVQIADCRADGSRKSEVARVWHRASFGDLSSPEPTWNALHA